MTAFDYIEKVGANTPTFGSNVMQSALRYIGVNAEVERENKRSEHARVWNQFLRSIV